VTLLTESRLIGLFLARQHGHPISFGQFARYGVPVALGSVALCVPYLLLRYA
jgi:Na+/H+ antiporter NhaD/arsenite permease-like protein